MYVCIYVCVRKPLRFYDLRNLVVLESRGIAVAISYRIGQAHGLHHIHDI
jgi:hypothetical protein